MIFISIENRSTQNLGKEMLEFRDHQPTIRQ